MIKDKKNYITSHGYQKLLDELQQLMRIERPEITNLIQWAASNGDRSENADYLYGKRRLREIDRRIRFLTARIEAAVVVNPAQTKSDRIQFGASVEVMDERGESRTYTIVGVDEVNTQLGHISWQSPIGRSLLGKTQGEEVRIETPSGEIFLEIVWIKYRTVE